MARIKDELSDYKQAINKAMQVDTVEEERLLDIFEALSKVKVDLDLLKQTGMVQVLQGVKKKFPEGKVGMKCKNLLVKWKKECSSGDSQTSDEPALSPSKPKGTEEAQKPTIKEADIDKKPAANPRPEPSLSSRSAEDEEEWDDGGYSKNLHPARQKVIQVLAEQLQISANAKIALFAATNVEASINAQNSVERDQKAYLSKARTLTFNLKNNERLRGDVMDGTIPAHVLVTLNAKDLATDALKETREETTKSATMARRGDLYEITRSEILAANGIDPNKGGEFVCRKCKGTKTSHYALQTRSSDEPMTIFVCCLTCGKRWRS